MEVKFGHTETILIVLASLKEHGVLQFCVNAEHMLAALWNYSLSGTITVNPV